MFAWTLALIGSLVCCTPPGMHQPWLMAAAVAEILGEGDKALSYLTKVIMPRGASTQEPYTRPTAKQAQDWIVKEGQIGVVSQVLGGCMRARVFANCHDKTDEAIATLEETIEIAEFYESWLLVALCLRDMWVIAPRQRAAIERRIGDCLRRMPNATPDKLDEMLNNSFAHCYVEQEKPQFNCGRLMQM
jgi:hypothetical protein